jgi:hypothetical protein
MPVAVPTSSGPFPLSVDGLDTSKYFSGYSVFWFRQYALYPSCDTSPIKYSQDMPYAPLTRYGCAMGRNDSPMSDV